jgi:endoglucanase
MGWPNVQTMAQLDYLMLNQPKADSTIKINLKNGLINYCSSLYNIVKNDGFHVSLHTYEYYWGSNPVALYKAAILIIGYDLSGNMNFYNAALDQFNYILGCNGNDICYITDVGTKYPMNPHHRPSASDKIVEPVPGLMAGGPDEGLDDAVLQSMYTSSTSPALCYIDNQGSYASNEIAINWNAPLVFVAGYFSGKKDVTDIKERMGSIPNRFQIEQNYPNPFNPTTVIGYQLAVRSRVTLRIFDTMGREVGTLVNGVKPAGNYRVKFNAEGLASGIYFYTLTAGDFSKTKKLVLLK